MLDCSVYVSRERAVALVEEFEANGVVIPPPLIRLIPFVEVVLWARAQRHPVDVQQIQNRWSCSRASAYRYHRALYGSVAAARGRSPLGRERLEAAARSRAARAARQGRAP